jgi:hypothetical protein
VKEIHFMKHKPQTVNPGSLQSQVFVMTIPINPVAATTQEETSLGPIRRNGVAIYNDREGGNVPVDAGTLNLRQSGSSQWTRRPTTL